MLKSTLGLKSKKQKFQDETVKNSLMFDANHIPKHVAIIMDGNGRWAKRFGMPRSMGHRKGADVLRNIVSTAKEIGIKVLTVYGFSTENWKRPEQEVSFLMKLIGEYLTSNVKAMHENNVRIRFIGYIPALPKHLVNIIAEAEALTSDNDGIILQLAINYGGRNELVRTFKTIANKVRDHEISIDEIDEDLISDYLDTREFSDVDLLIRPSNDFRISNFLLWQLAYAEFWFTDKHWPEFTGETLKEAVLAYQGRERRFGGLKDEE